MHYLIEGLSGVEVVADDFIVYGCGEMDEEAIWNHDTKLHHFLRRCEEHHVVLEEGKLKLKLKEVPLLVI